MGVVMVKKEANRRSRWDRRKFGCELIWFLHLLWRLLAVSIPFAMYDVKKCKIFCLIGNVGILEFRILYNINFVYDARWGLMPTLCEGMRAAQSPQSP